MTLLHPPPPPPTSWGGNWLTKLIIATSQVSNRNWTSKEGNTTAPLTPMPPNNDTIYRCWHGSSNFTVRHWLKFRSVKMPCYKFEKSVSCVGVGRVARLRRKTLRKSNHHLHVMTNIKQIFLIIFKIWPIVHCWPAIILSPEVTIRLESVEQCLLFPYHHIFTTLVVRLP